MHSCFVFFANCALSIYLTDRFFDNDDEFLAVDGLADSIPALEAPQPRKIKGIEVKILLPWIEYSKNSSITMCSK